MRYLTGDQIRQMWLDFFKSKGHYIEPSASLIPNNDPTLLWINSGVAALKKYFDGSEIPPHKRITNAQKSIRTNDIDNVGRTARHHTFFEMLGNFSIGDYFRNDVLPWAYELLTSEKYFGIPTDKLFITYHPSDKDTYNLWIKLGIDKDHLIPSEHNFWEIGEGPCGPNTEMYYDRGEKYDPDHLGVKLLYDDLDNDRYIELWNIVFSQFNAEKGKKREEYSELPHKNIDTGAGLERLACIFQNTETNFETDLFYPYIKEIQKISPHPYEGEYLMAYRVVADHIRACTFALADGATFSNEGRGYVLRRLLRRASLYLRKLGIDKPYLYTLVPLVCSVMNSYYPYLKEHEDKVSKMIKFEEEKFSKTLKGGQELILSLIDKAKKENKTTISGKEVFKLYDTFGFPFELSNEIVSDHSLSIDKEEFDQAMENQKSQSRNARGDLQSMSAQNADLMEFKEPSTFVYESEPLKAKVIGLFKDGQKVTSLDEEGDIIFDITNFYATSGGQEGDVGIIVNDKTQGKITKVIKAVNKQNLHHVEIEYGTINVGDEFTLQIDENRRNKTMQNHSCTHLLQKALQVVLGDDVHQEGSYNCKDYLRFDFNYPNKISNDDLRKIESLVNQYINQDLKCQVSYYKKEEAEKLKAMHLFSEKYGDIIRVVSFGDVSSEFCGGTHVSSTKDIGLFIITKEEAIASGIRRIEGKTGFDAYLELKKYQEIVNSLTISLKANAPTLLEKKIDELTAENSSLKKTISSLNDKLASYQGKELKNEFIALNDAHLLVHKFSSLDSKAFMSIFDSLKTIYDDYVILLANVVDSRIMFVSGVSSKLVSKYNAGDIVKKIAQMTDGRGGGRKDSAQGGGKDISKLDESLKIMKEELSK